MDFQRTDQQLAEGSLVLDRGLVQAYGAASLAHPVADYMRKVKRISMLAVETLVLLRAFALASRSGVLEIGPYVGGSTIALLKGVEDSGPAASGRAFISVDVGGAQDHDAIPTADIHADWARNLAEAGFAGRSRLIKGYPNAPEVAAEIVSALGGQKIGLLVIDADGQVWQHIRYLGSQLADDCLLVVDDVTNLNEPDDPDRNVKFGPTRDAVAAGIDAGVIEHYGTSCGAPGLAGASRAFERRCRTSSRWRQTVGNPTTAGRASLGHANDILVKVR